MNILIKQHNAKRADIMTKLKHVCVWHMPNIIFYGKKERGPAEFVNVNEDL